jgi:hypothetical protein
MSLDHRKTCRAMVPLGGTHQPLNSASLMQSFPTVYAHRPKWSVVAVDCPLVYTVEQHAAVYRFILQMMYSCAIIMQAGLIVSL